jgi:hypothetical protein
MTCGALANSARPIVVNELLEPASGASSTIELYVSRLGTYYAELYLERDGMSVPPAAAVSTGVKFTFLRGEEVLLERDVVATFDPGQPARTLLLLDIPRDLPQRKALAMVVTLHDVDPALREAATSLRLQLTRKVQLSPLRR